MTESCPSPYLCFVDDSLPGFTRRKLKHGWAYYDADGARITDRDEIDRLNAIGMPPAYQDCWFSPTPHGHIQAIGKDARGRRQYRYHPAFRAGQEQSKFMRCAEFGHALPRLRARVEEDIHTRRLSREAVIAAVIRLLDLGRVRVGNESYAQANESFGATTLRRLHAQLTRSALTLEFKGKSGKMHRIRMSDRHLIRIIRRCQDLEGQHLFQYVDAEGEPHRIGSGDVNAYIKETMGEAFSAKNFRTWSASVIAFEALCTARAPLSVKKLVEPVAQLLGNTPAIARKSYVHPALIELAQSSRTLSDVRLPRKSRYLSRAERGLIAFLEEQGKECGDADTGRAKAA